MSIERPKHVPGETPEQMASRLTGDLELSPVDSKAARESPATNEQWETRTPRALFESINHVLAILPTTERGLQGISLRAEQSARPEPGMVAIDIYVTEGSETTLLAQRVLIGQQQTKADFERDIKTALLRSGYLYSTPTLVSKTD